MTYAMTMTDERYVQATVCHGCHGAGRTIHLVATASGETSQQVDVCRWCNGTGRLKGFVPPE